MDDDGFVEGAKVAFECARCEKWFFISNTQENKEIDMCLACIDEWFEFFVTPFLGNAHED